MRALPYKFRSIIDIRKRRFVKLVYNKDHHFFWVDANLNLQVLEKEYRQARTKGKRKGESKM